MQSQLKCSFLLFCRAEGPAQCCAGIDAVAASLALLTSPHPPARKLALHSLLQPEFLSRLADKVDDEVSLWSAKEGGRARRQVLPLIVLRPQR